MSIKKQAVKKNEGKLIVMNGKRELNGTEWQLERISDYPLQIKENMIVLDELELGCLHIYKPNAEGPSYVQFIADTSYVNAALVGEIKISVYMEEKGIIIEEITCENGYENLAKPMIDQVNHFVNFYVDFDKLGMEDSVWQKWGFLFKN